MAPAAHALARAAALTGDTAAPGLSLRKDSPLPAAATAYSGAHWLPTQRRLSASMTMLGSISGGCLEPPNSLGADTSLRGQAASACGAWSTSPAAAFIPDALGGGPILFYYSSPHDQPEAGDRERSSNGELLAKPLPTPLLAAVPLPHAALHSGAPPPAALRSGAYHH